MWCFWAKISLLKGFCKEILIYVICKEHINTVHGSNALTTWLFSCRWKDESEWCFWPVDLHDDTGGQFTDCPSSDLEGAKIGTKEWTDENSHISSQKAGMRHLFPVRVQDKKSLYFTEYLMIHLVTGSWFCFLWEVLTCVAVVSSLNIRGQHWIKIYLAMFSLNSLHTHFFCIYVHDLYPLGFCNDFYQH